MAFSKQKNAAFSVGRPTPIVGESSGGLKLSNTDVRPVPGRRARVAGFVWAVFLRAVCATWIKRYQGFEAIDDARRQARKMMLCFWHGKYLSIFALCRWLWIEKRGETACVFTSRSARGEVISEICRHFGLDCIQIPDRGRKLSYQLMRDALATHSAGVIAVDGPLGPYHQVKQGAIRLASDLGYYLVPASVSVKRKKVSENRWDRMEFPVPFTPIGLAMGEPIEVPAELDKAKMRDLIRDLHDKLEFLEQQAEKLLSAPGHQEILKKGG